MKKIASFLLAVVLLLAISPILRAQAPSPVSAELADELLQKISGDWVLSLLKWDPETKQNSTFSGTCRIMPDKKRNMNEQVYFFQPNGTPMKANGCFRYSKKSRSIEFVAKGKNQVLMASKWYPEQKTLIFYPISEQDNKLRGQQWHYVFLQDGTFSKLIHTKDAQGNYGLTSIHHYKRAAVAGL